MGGVLAGNRDFIEATWWWKQRLGGGMRQAGILAAAGIYALEHNISQLAKDHEHARLFAESITNIPGIALDVAGIETNIVFFDVMSTGLSAFEVSEQLKPHGWGYR
ncbi:L-allo-threonine aldolase [Candidatus Nitrosacidococcus sp. I8]|nr:L-allo-threonine aldolase [Candidatus Nitrosacidococcus sp. I8]